MNTIALVLLIVIVGATILGITWIHTRPPNNTYEDDRDK